MNKNTIKILDINNKKSLECLESKMEGATPMNIYEISKNIKLEDGTKALENLLLNIYFNSGISTKQLSRNSHLPTPVVSAIKKEFTKQGLLLQDYGVKTTAAGNIFVEESLGFKDINKALYLKLLDNPFGSHDELKDTYNNLNYIFEHRPSADVSIDQSKCTVATALKRALLCLKYEALIGKKILCVGDDDLVSIALALLLKLLFEDKKHKSSICVMDIDSRFLDYISCVAVKEELPITCVNTNFRYPILEEYKGQFDCFFTDPPYTLQGMNLFLSRGIEGLKREKSLPIFFSFAHKAPDFELDMQRNFISMGIKLSEILPGFNVYEGAQIIGSSSQMIVLKTTGNTKSLINEIFYEPMYTGEIKKTSRVYKCTCCGKEHKVGFSEIYKTIEVLKTTGCNNCGKNSFKLIDKITV